MAHFWLRFLRFTSSLIRFIDSTPLLRCGVDECSGVLLNSFIIALCVRVTPKRTRVRWINCDLMYVDRNYAVSETVHVLL
jgi:hypothetical protein